MRTLCREVLKQGNPGSEQVDHFGTASSIFHSHKPKSHIITLVTPRETPAGPKETQKHKENEITFHCIYGTAVHTFPKENYENGK